MAAFGNSDEFQSRFSNLSNAELVNNIYLRLFNREAEQAGMDYFIDLLESGQSSLSQIAVEILNLENSVDFVARLSLGGPHKC